jgi:hypothetical protein
MEIKAGPIESAQTMGKGLVEQVDKDHDREVECIQDNITRFPVGKQD